MNGCSATNGFSKVNGHGETNGYDNIYSETNGVQETCIKRAKITMDDDPRR
jgi:hypothetical protein